MTEKTEAKTVEIVPKEEAVDEKLVEEATEYIHERLASIAKDTVEIGAFIFERFFEGKLESVTSKDPTKNASFSELTKRCGTPAMPVSKTFLHNALWTGVACKKLPAGAAFRKLLPSHQTALLPLRQEDDFEKVERLAEKVVEKKLTVEKVRELVGKEVAKQPKDEGKGGRPPKPLIVKTLDRSLKIFTFEEGKRSFTNADVAQLSDDQVKHALESAEKLAKSLDGLIERLKKKA